MQILDLPEGKISLEFKPREASQILRRLEQFGSVRRTPGAIHQLITVGKVELIYYSEWDEPCLISTTLAGSNLLRDLAAKPVRSKAA